MSRAMRAVRAVFWSKRLKCLARPTLDGQGEASLYSFDCSTVAAQVQIQYLPQN